MNASVDRIVVIRGAAGGLLLAMTAALANVVLAGQDPKPHGAINVTFLLTIVGFFLAGFVAGYEADHEVARHGAYAGLAAWVPVEIVAILGRLDRGDPVSILGIVFVAFLAAVAGMAGSRPGQARKLRRIQRDERAANQAHRPGGDPS